MALPAMLPSIDDVVIARVLARCPIEAPYSAEPMEATKRNDNFLVEDAARRRYVLRRYRRNPDVRRMRFQLAFQQELYRLGYPYQALLSRAGEDSLAAFRHDVLLMRKLESEMETLSPMFGR